MIETLTFVNLDAVSIELNTAIYPLHLYDTDINSRLEKRPKSGQNGSWPTYSYDEGMEITMEGDILADDSDDYWTKRYALSSCIRFKPSTPQRRSGVLFVTFDNAPEMFQADVAVDSFSASRNGVSPGFGPFRLVLWSFNPYYTGSVSGDPYYDG